MGISKSELLYEEKRREGGDEGHSEDACEERHHYAHERSHPGSGGWCGLCAHPLFELDLAKVLDALNIRRVRKGAGLGSHPESLPCRDPVDRGIELRKS